MKNKISSIILVLIFLAGLSLLLYPSVSDYWNSLHQTKAITDYADEVSKLDKEAYERIRKSAEDYNARLAEKGTQYHLTEEEQKEYESQLAVSDSRVIAYIEISKIHCTLPICHGTEEGTLQNSIGHIEWSSLPVGGKSSHCVLSGHRGLPSARLFTDLDQMEEGDTFVLRVLDETLTYEVDQIRIVLPEEVEELQIIEGKDYCTPYGVNSHRLLVRGHRVENEDADSIRVTADALQIEPTLIAPVIAVPMLLVLLIILLVKTRKNKKINKEEEVDVYTKTNFQPASVGMSVLGSRHNSMRS